MQEITDPRVLQELHSQRGVTPQEEPEQETNWFTHKTEDASVGEALKSRLGLGLRAFAHSQANPEYSQLSKKMLADKAAEAQAEEDKLSVLGKVGLEFGKMAPVLAAGAINPALGGVVASGIYGVDTMAQQAMMGQDVDVDKALMAGLGTAAVDTLTGGLGNKLHKAYGLASRPLARTATDVTEGAVGGIAGNAFTNLATGRPWDEGLGMSAVGGGAAGGVIGAGMHGLNKALNLAPNKAGEKTIENLAALKSSGEVNPSDKVAKEAFSYNNIYDDLMTQARKSSSPEERQQFIDAAVNLSNDGGGEAAVIDALRLAQDGNLPLMLHAFDTRVKRGLGENSEELDLREAFGISKEDIQESGEAAAGAHTGHLGRAKAGDQRLTKEADETDFQEKYKALSGKLKGSFTENHSTALHALKVAEETPGFPAQDLKKLRNLVSDLGDLKSRMNEATGNEKLLVGDSVALLSNRIISNAMDVGIYDKLKGLDGSTGNYNPAHTVRTLDTLEKMSKARMSNLHQGAPNRFSSGPLGTGVTGAVIDASLLASGNILPAIARRTVATVGEELGAKMSQSRLKKQKQKGSELLAGVDAARKRAMAEGDMELAAAASRRSLEDAGINTGTPPEGPSGPSGAPRDDLPVIPPQSEPEVSPVVAPATPKPPATPLPNKASPLGAYSKVVRDGKLTEEEALAKIQGMSEIGLNPNNPKHVKDYEALTAQQVETPEVKPEPQPGALIGSPKKVEQKTTAPEPVAESTPEVPPATEATPEPDIKEVSGPVPVKAPKKKEEPKVEEPEAPVSRSEELSKQPKQVARKEPEVEQKVSEEPTERVEELTPEEAPVVEEKSSLANLRNPLEKARKEYEDLSPDQKSSMMANQPEEYHRIRRASSDIEDINTIVDNLSQKKDISDEMVASVIEDLGGMQGVRDSIKKDDLRITPQEYVLRRLKDVMEVKRGEVKKVAKEVKVAAKEVTNNPPKGTSSEAIAKKINDKHVSIRDELVSLGYDKGTIDEALKLGKASDTGVDFDPKIVRNHARTLDKARLKKAQKDAKDAKDELERINKANALPNAKAEIDAYLKDSGVEDHPEISDAVSAVFKNAKSAPTERQVKALKDKIDTIIRNDLEAYQKALESPKTLEVAELAHYRKTVGNLRSAREALEASEKVIKEKKAKQQAAAKEAAEAQKEADKVNKEVSTREVELEEIEAREVTRKDTALLEDTAPQAEAVREAVVEKISDLDASQLQLLTKEMTQVKDSVKDYSSPEQKGALDALGDVLSDSGFKDEGDYVKYFAELLAIAEKRKQAYPDLPEVWILGDEKQKLQRMIKPEKLENSWMGNLQKQLNLRFHGDAELGGAKIRLSRAEADKRIAEYKAGKVDPDLKVVNQGKLSEESLRDLRPEPVAAESTPYKYAQSAANIESVLKQKALNVDDNKISYLNGMVDDLKKELMEALKEGAKVTSSWSAGLDTAIKNLQPRRSKEAWKKQIKDLKLALKEARDYKE